MTVSTWELIGGPRCGTKITAHLSVHDGIRIPVRAGLSFCSVSDSEARPTELMTYWYKPECQKDFDERIMRFQGIDEI